MEIGVWVIQLYVISIEIPKQKWKTQENKRICVVWFKKEVLKDLTSTPPTASEESFMATINKNLIKCGGAAAAGVCNKHPRAG